MWVELTRELRRIVASRLLLFGKVPHVCDRSSYERELIAANDARARGWQMKKILIADDDKTFCELLSAEMRLAGWSVTVAADAMQTIMYALRVQPDVIVLDVQMPGGTGVTALSKLKASSKTAGIPVLVVSGSAQPSIETTLLQAGAARYVGKPADVEQLRTAIEELVRGPGAG
jgi:CheY-like chemotaxis protein